MPVCFVGHDADEAEAVDVPLFNAFALLQHLHVLEHPRHLARPQLDYAHIVQLTQLLLQTYNHLLGDIHFCLQHPLLPSLVLLPLLHFLLPPPPLLLLPPPLLLLPPSVLLLPFFPLSLAELQYGSDNVVKFIEGHIVPVRDVVLDATGKELKIEEVAPIDLVLGDDVLDAVVDLDEVGEAQHVLHRPV